MEEIWKDIKDYEGLYQVSNLGNVKSLPKMSGTSKRKETILKTHIEKRGYFVIRLSKNKTNHSFKIHRLIANAFIPNPENKRTINHIDGNKLNNSISNLEWATDSENLQHAYDTGLKPKKPINQYTLGKSFIKEWESAQQIYKTLGFDYRNISACCHGKQVTGYGYIWKFKEE